MERIIIQVSIEELKLINRGTINNGSDNDINLFRFTMNQPAEGIQQIETVKVVKAKDDIPTEWSDFDMGLVFKSALRGKSKLRVEALSVDKKGGAEKFFKKFLSAVLGVWTGGFSNAYVGAVTQLAGGSLIELIDDDDDSDVIGIATFILDSNDLQRTIQCELSVREPVKKRTVKPKKNRRNSTKEKIVVPKGSNGSITLRIERLA